MNICLIGGCGYIGSRLFQHLSRHHRVSSFDLELRGNPGRIRNVRSDYRNLKYFRQFDAVILLAGHSSVGACERDHYGAMSNNLFGPIELAQKLGRQVFIYASSASVYSSSDGKRENVYDFTKAACDEAMRLIHPSHYALRFGTVCGPSPNMRLDLMLNAMVHGAIIKNSITMQNPDIKRPLLGMDDLCAVVDRCLLREPPYGQQNL
ncbi:MAG: SDR family oxidoreductase, partial [Patescibacteria group bacterium]|nr:SDR family oxidoreductase [Patescibacteria group bacterium]